MAMGTTDAEGLDFLAGGGEMERRIRAFDWTKTSLGAPAGWPQSLKTALKIALNSRYPIWMGWGWDLVNLYNDPYIPVLGKRDEWALGASARQVWKEIWEAHLGPQADAVLLRGEASWNDQRQMVMYRNGYAEETYFTFSFSPLPADEGGVGGLFCACTEDTRKVLGERRLAALRNLAASTADSRTERDAVEVAARVLTEHGGDVAFALIYLIDPDGEAARLAAASVDESGATWAPQSVQFAQPDPLSPWPLARTLTEGSQVLRDISPDLGLPGGAWPEPASIAAVLPLARAGHENARGFLIVGASPRLPFDENYESFFELLARGVADSLSNARAYEEERKRAEALAELDRAKTQFFSNVSHEFRTPLTLMLGPVEDLLNHGRLQSAPEAREQLELVHRNSLRLLKLVNTMLDFSRIEAGRMTAVYEPVDLPAYTAELASSFRSACERAGLRLLIDCPPLSGSELAFVDRDMWEKIVLNLLSNAFKFTLQGEIEVRVARGGQHFAELTVRDTGVGIPQTELPRMFDRFHRIESSRGRTHEGSGIGLALVHELVKLHAGSVRVESMLGHGSRFIVHIPLGRAHLDPQRVKQASQTHAGNRANAFVEEALRWLPDAEAQTEPAVRQVLDDVTGYRPRPASSGDRARVLWADDNADMRDYVARLLRERFEVEAVSDGRAALQAAQRRRPDLVLTDIMMPHLDGFGLLRELRADTALRDVPVIMLSARAGEESRIEGVEAGADDYLVKPFSARELIARVDAHLRMARLRQETERTRRESEDQVRRAHDELAHRIAELERANSDIRQARRAALNLMDDALKAKEALERHAQRFEALVNNAPLGVYLVDADLHICEVNPVAAPVFGDIPGGVLGRDFAEIIHILWEQPYADEIVRIFRHTLETGEPYVTQERAEPRLDRGVTECYEWRVDRLTLPDGRFGLVCYFRDISTQVQARRLIAESERRFRCLVEVLTDVPWTTDGAGRFVEPQAAWCSYTGQSWEQHRDFGWLDALHPEDRDHIRELWQQACKARTEYAWSGRVWHVATGQYRYFEARAVPIMDQDAPELVHEWVGSCTDVHERMLAERALREADRRKDEFLATLAHELRNPLAPIRQATHVARLPQATEAQLRWSSSVVERQVQHMALLLDDLLDVSRITRGKLELRKEPLLLSKAVEAAVETVRPAIDARRHVLTVELPDAPVSFMGDPLRLAQVLSNLLSNAAKYTDAGGHIRLSAQVEGDELLVRVRDNGIGVSADALPKLFTMFTQVKSALERSEGGLGIGLALAKGLVELHGGRISAHSAGLGQGTEFMVRLPLAAAAVSLPSMDAPSVPFAAGAGRRVLVVDDNRDAADSLAMLLSMHGYSVEVAGDGSMALERAADFQPDIMLLDIGMPGLNGYELARRIRQQPWGGATRLAAITGWGQAEDKARARAAGFDHHLTKPVDPAEVLALVALAVASRGGTQPAVTEGSR